MGGGGRRERISLHRSSSTEADGEITMLADARVRHKDGPGLGAAGGAETPHGPLTFWRGVKYMS